MNVLDTEATRKRVPGVFGTAHRRDAIPEARVNSGSPPSVIRIAPEKSAESANSETVFSRTAGSKAPTPSTPVTETPWQRNCPQPLMIINGFQPVVNRFMSRHGTSKPLSLMMVFKPIEIARATRRRFPAYDHRRLRTDHERPSERRMPR
ncbi:hypothetical protein ACFY9F_32345 [Streptomyces sp. NPDC012421]|uniref:hypothetical protein n=1 Tax=unclassified Streptomyces TaxID=2593676 RepID=UPI00367A8FA9